MQELLELLEFLVHPESKEKTREMRLLSCAIIDGGRSSPSLTTDHWRECKYLKELYFFISIGLVFT